ncbi:type II toxin-antitoxin system HicA family toxin [Anthocerotibacter panamensis]|uniref:type II toxin-antitoxin system HicA family toxin n=1 Tax=Anthocerotibacter panamensis TaxID=2857077 RepID=UPI001C407E1B|nr:type II toxin-antitoxin system HicA family toxin [Anthocerotibacter panamensis]
MPKAPRLTAQEAERLLLKAGFVFLRSEGSHHIYGKARLRIVLPFHSGKTLHPKIIKQILKAIEPGDEEG